MSKVQLYSSVFREGQTNCCPHKSITVSLSVGVCVQSCDCVDLVFIKSKMLFEAPGFNNEGGECMHDEDSQSQSPSVTPPSECLVPPPGSS